MRIERIDVTNFKSILRESIVLDSRLTLFVGGNDSGKSNILDTIARFRQVPDKSCFSQLASAVPDPYPSLEVTFDNLDADDIRRAPAVVLEAAARTGSKFVFRREIGGGVVLQVNEKGRRQGQLEDDLANWLPEVISLHSEDVHLLPDEVDFREYSRNESDYPAFRLLLETGGLEPPEELLKLDEIQRRRRLRDLNLRVSPGLTDIWRGDRSTRLCLTVERDLVRILVADSSNSEVPVSDRGDGFQWFLALWLHLEAAKAATQPNALLLMDEPDQWLHASAQRDLSRMLEGVTDHFQIVFTTHSPFMIDGNHLERVRVVHRTQSGTKVRAVNHLADPEPLSTSIGTIASGPLIMGTQNVFVEGPSDQILMVGMALLLSQQGKCPLDLNQLKFIASGGDECTVLRAAAAKADRLAYCIVIDADAKTRPRFRKAEKVYGITHTKTKFLGPEPDGSIEDTFPPDLYLTAVNRHYSSMVRRFRPLTAEKGPVCRYVSQKLDEQDLDFDKVGVARQLISMLFSDDQSEQTAHTLKTYEALFEDLRRILAVPG